ncbi:MAG TPA: hypothetical protein VF835_00995 [Rhizomicrobium sp.]
MPGNPTWRMFTPLDQFDEYGGATLGLDGRVWFADQTGTAFVVFNERGKYTTVSTGSYALERTARGPNGDIYATTGYSPTIVRFSLPTGKVTTLTLGQSANGAITAGPDGSIWIPEESEVGRILSDGTVREYPVGDSLGGGTAITEQMGGDVWFDAGNYLASMHPSNGAITKHLDDACGEYVLPTVAAPDGLVWAVCKGYLDGFTRSGVAQRVPLPADLGFGIVGGYDNALVGPDNAIWIAGQNVVNNVAVSAAFVRFDLVTHKLHKFVPPNESYEWDAAFTFDPAGDLWGGTDNGQVQEIIFRR